MLWLVFSSAALFGCSSINPLNQSRLSQSFVDQVIAYNEAYRAELNGQVLLNILRARDRQYRSYTSLSELQLTPRATVTNELSSEGLDVGDNATPISIVVGGSRTVERQSLSQLRINPAAVDSNQQSIYQQPCLLYTSPSPRDATLSRMPSSA